MLDIESIVFTRIKYGVGNKLTSTYPKLNFTTSDRASTLPNFPTVYIHELGSAERGQDLEGTTINAILSTIQVEVTDNSDPANAKQVMDEVVKVMKTMRYEVNSMPEFNNTNEVYRRVARFRRIVGASDTL